MRPIKHRDAEKYLRSKKFVDQGGSRGKGSHSVWKNKAGISVTVPGHEEIKGGTWDSIKNKVDEAYRAERAAEAKAAAAAAQQAAGRGVTKPGGKGTGDGSKTRRHDTGHGKTRGFGRS